MKDQKNTSSPGEKRGLPGAEMRSPSLEASDGDRRRAGLKRLLTQKGLSPTDLARIIELKSPNAIFNFLSGRSDALSLATIEKIAMRFSDFDFFDLAGLKPSMAAKQDGELPGVLVTIELAAGVWRHHYELPAEQWTPLPLPPEFASKTDTLLAARVSEPGAESLYPANTVLLCQQPVVAPQLITAGSRCIVARTRRTTVEVTVRELQHWNGEPWLWLRSTNPHHHEPLRVFTRNNGDTCGDDRQAPIEVIGVVVASWQPESATPKV